MPLMGLIIDVGTKNQSWIFFKTFSKLKKLKECMSHQPSLYSQVHNPFQATNYAEVLVLKFV